MQDLNRFERFLAKRLPEVPSSGRNPRKWTLDSILCAFVKLLRLSPSSPVPAMKSSQPFTFVKEMLSVVICLLIYKPLSPLIHGTSR